MSDVFVSYKAEDRRRVKPLVEALQSEGFSVWWDEQIDGGSAWRQAIETELNAAKCVIVIWSNRSVGPEGTFVQDEATRAQQRHVYVPVLIDKVHMPLGFGETQALPLIGWRGDRSDVRYAAVLAAVRRNVGGKRRSISSPLPRAHVDRRSVIAGGGVAVGIVAGAGAWVLLKPGSAAAASDSIAVLPFENLSGNPAQAYFSDGIAEEIRSSLARIAGLKVVGRTSSEAVRNDDSATAAKKLGVGNILTGSVRQSPSTIRITAELIDGRSGIDRWSQNYDRSPGDAIKIQTDIAANVASALSVALGRVAAAAAAVGGTSNAQAQDLLLRARTALQGESRSTLMQARDLAGRAIQLDPRYADAYALKSVAIGHLASTYAGNSRAFEAGNAEALQLANTAIQLAPRLERGFRARAAVLQDGLRLAEAARDFQRAAALAPGDPRTIRDYSNFLSFLGSTSQALPLADKAILGDPLDALSYENRVAILYHSRRYGDAIAESERIKRESPELFNWPILLGTCYLDAGNLEAARRSLDEAEKAQPIRLAAEGVLAARRHDGAAAQAAIVNIRRLFGDAANYQYAQVHAQLGETEEAFADLQHALKARDPGLINLLVDPWLDPLRSDPRFAELLRIVNFPSA